MKELEFTQEIRVGGRNYSLTNNLGYLKFYNEENPKDYFENIKVISDKIALEIGIDQVVTENYLTLYKQNLEVFTFIPYFIK